MSSATTPAEGEIKAKVKAAAMKQLGAEFDEDEFDEAFAEAYSETATFDEVYTKAVRILRGKDEPDAKEAALRKLANDAMDRKR